MTALAALVGLACGLALGLLSDAVVRRLEPTLEDKLDTVPALQALGGRRPMLAVGCLCGLAAGVVLGLRPALLPALGLIGFLLPLTAIDLRWQLLPRRLTRPGIAVGLVLAIAADPEHWLRYPIAAAAGYAVFFLFAVVYPAGMGYGDVMLVALLGAFLGVALVPAVVVAFAAAAVPSLAVIALRGRAGRKTAFPFGPFLAFGGVVAMLWGGALIDWYLQR